MSGNCDGEPFSKRVCFDEKNVESCDNQQLKTTANKLKRRKKPKSLHNQYSMMKQKTEEYNKDETEYFFENGFRKVFPYYFTFNTFCKGRWLGRTLRDIFTSEFRFHSIEHYERARKCGHLLVNMQAVESLDMKLKDNDLLSSKLHRHEAPVIASEIKIICENSHFLVVDKPSSIPIHPCGRYRNNTLCYILRKEHGFESLFGCHRLDRLTSGIVIFAKTKHFANKIITEIRERKVEKEYICKVIGEFPSDAEGIVCNEVVTVFDKKIGCSCAWKVDGFDSKDALTHFYRLSTDGQTSVLLCKPKTGRTHQIRVHLQYLGFPIVNDPMYNHEAWGEERFKHGPCTRNVLDVSLAISRTYENDAHVMLSNPVSSTTNASDAAVSAEPCDFDKNNSKTLPTVYKTQRSEAETSSSVQTNFTETSINPDKAFGNPDKTLANLNDAIANTNETLVISDQTIVNTDKTFPNSNRTLANTNETSSHESQTQNNAIVESANDIGEESNEAKTFSCEDQTVDNPHFCPTCPECVRPLPDPDMRWMAMCLHACRYKGSDWEFKTDMPKWAEYEESSSS